MKRKYLISAYRFLFAGLLLAAVIVNLQRTADLHDSIIHFYSYFTYQSSLYAAIIFLVGAITLLHSRESKMLAYWRGAAVMYTTITGVVYILLLRSTDTSSIVWANDLLHYIFPVVMLADWFIDIPKFKIVFNKALLWTVYPVVYLVFTLIRGHQTGWYPYPFLNPDNGGYKSVALTSLVILAGSIALMGLLSYTTKQKRHGKPTKHSTEEAVSG